MVKGGQKRIAALPQKEADSVFVDLNCQKCKNTFRLQANLKEGIPIQEGSVSFPKDNKVLCPFCGTEHDLGNARREIEGKVGGY